MDTNEHRDSGTDSPDFPHLPDNARLRIAVAKTQGEGWTRYEAQDGTDGGWELLGPGPVVLCRVYDAYPDRLLCTPDYLTDPAAWGALMERERISLYPAFSSDYKRPWEARWGVNDERDMDAAVAGTPGRAACLAVLAKHGIAWPA